MSLCHLTRWRSGAAALVLAVVVVAMPALLNAQDETPKVELFIGYQWLNPGGNVPDQSTSPPTAVEMPSLPKGFGTNVAYNFTKNLALEANYGGDWNSGDSINMFSVGPKITYRGDGVNFFVHTLLGFERLESKGNDSKNGLAAILGGGMDLKLWKPVSLRVFEADFQWARQDFASVPLDDSSLRHPDYHGARLTTGLVFNFGGAPELPVAAACSIDHSEVMVGEPLHVTVAPSNFNPKHTLAYSWSSNGGKIEGRDTGATADMSGGSYTATAKVTKAKTKKKGQATYSSNFTVKEPPKNPPQIS